MNNSRQCPIPTRGGLDCWEPPHPDSQLSLCERHLALAAKDYEIPVNISHSRCKYCQLITLRKSLADNLLYCTNRDCARVQYDQDVLADEELEAKQLEFSKNQARLYRFNVVYYLRWADRIKIGTTAELRTRLRSIYHDEVLAVEQGSSQLEADRHKQFAASRYPRYKEWFTITPDLVEHINALRQQHGEPIAASERWLVERNEAA